jgi:hypothetical protein
MQIACEVEREYEQYHIREAGQLTRGMTVTDEWLKKYGYWPLSKHNIEAVTDACLALASGAVLDSYAASRVPEDLGFKESSTSYRKKG